MHFNLTRALIRRLLLHFSLAALVFFIAHNQQLAAQTSSKALPVTQASSDWERYTVKDREFSVLLPTVPAMSTYTSTDWDPFSKGRRRLRNLIGAYAKGVVYAIQIFEVRQSLNEFIAESRESSGWDFKRDLSLAGVRGKQYAFENEAGKGLTQYFLLGQHVYVFRAQGSCLGNPDAGIPMFFGSIRFGSSPGGHVITDDPGDLKLNDTSDLANADVAPVLKSAEATYKVKVIMKPEPTYTDDARRNQTSGTVVLRSVFSSSGQVTNIRVRSGLPHGLTERAIAAARQIRFIPAIKDSRFVSVSIQIEYNFNLY